jgi:hypothetical protein
MHTVQTIVDIAPIAWTIFVISTGGGNGSGGNNRDGGDAHLQYCDAGDSCGVCGLLERGKMKLLSLIPTSCFDSQRAAHAIEN